MSANPCAVSGTAHIGIRLCCAICLLTALGATALQGQTTFASITGTVTDAAGAVVSNAKIEATQVESNYKYATVSNEAGNYTIAQLRPGTYVVRATAVGFAPFELADIVLAARDVRRVDIPLAVGSVQSSIEVTAGATVIETETARISDTRTAQAIKSLPVDRRSLWNYLALSPAVTTSTEGSWRRFSGSNRSQSGAAIDGVTTDDIEGGNQISPLVGYVDSYAEVRVDSANNSAEFGNIGQVTVISKSGTNTLHGAVFDYYSTPFFRARNPFALARARGINHYPGGNVGGPVYLPKIYNGKDKTFFFFSFETSRGSEVQQILTPTVPIAAWRRGDFSALLPGTVIRDPFTKASYPNNMIPANVLNPVSVKIQDRFYPLPNFGDPSVLQDQNYRELKSHAWDPNTYITTRGDHRFSDKAFFFARFTWQRSWNTGFEGNLPTLGQLWNRRDTRALASSFSYNIRPNLLNELRYGLNFDNNPLHGPVQGKALVNELGLRGLWDNLPDISGVLNIGFNGLPVQGISQTAWADPGNSKMAHVFQETLSWFRGRHSIKAGFNYLWGDWAEQAAGDNLFGNVTFSNRFTGHPYADFLLGVPTSMSRESPPIFNETIRSTYDFFVMDDFKVNPKLTVNLGLRYEYHPYWTGTLSAFDIASGRIVVPDGYLSKVSPLYPAGFVSIVDAGKAGYPSKTLIRPDKNNIAPRIGVAYRPWGVNTVFRSGFGIFYDNVVFKADAAGSPYTVSEPEFTNPSTPTVIFPWVFPATGSGPASANIPTAIRRDLRIPYSMQYNFTVEHQIGNTGLRASYVRTVMRQGIYRYNINQPQPDNRPYNQKPRLFPQYADILNIENGSFHDYNGFTAEVKRSFARGLLFQASWVWARDIGDLGWYYSTPENAYDRRRERAPWLDIPTHRISGNVLYQLPFGRGRKFFSHAPGAVEALAGGWELAVVAYFQTGQFLTPLWSGPDPTGTAYTESDSPAFVTIRPNILRNPNLPSDQRTLTQWFDPTAFAPPTPGNFGTSAKGVVIGPGSTVWHTTAAKSIALHERVRLRLEMTAFNVFNHPNWANPRMNITSSPGRITGVVGRNDLDSLGPRQLRASLRLEW